MKKNLKLNLSWLAIIVVLFGIIELLTKTNILNLYYIQILMGIGISILMGLGTNLVLGFSGQFTLGQAGFMAIGAYATAIITQQNPPFVKSPPLTITIRMISAIPSVAIAR